jgi:hypothetical protein
MRLERRRRSAKDAEEFLDSFHAYLKSWSSEPNDGGGFLNLQVEAQMGAGHEERADARIVAFSDTAIIRGGREYVLRDFFKLICSLQRGLEARGIRSFALICRGEEIQSPSLDVVADSFRVGDNQPSYVRAIGTGPVWTHLYTAFQMVESEIYRDWQERYRLYAVGRGSLPRGTSASETREILISRAEKIELIAVE